MDLVDCAKKICIMVHIHKKEWEMTQLWKLLKEKSSFIR